MKKREEERRRRRRRRRSRNWKREGRALPTYNTVEQEILFYYKHTFFFTLRKRPEEAIANAMVADPKHLLPLQIRIIALQLRAILFMFCANERAEGRR